MSSSRFFVLSRKGRADPSADEAVITEAIAALQPRAQQAWQRSIRYWSTRKTGVDEGQLRTSVGALQPLVTIEAGGALVLLRAGKGVAVQHAIEVGLDMPGLLRAMQYREVKEVRCAGHVSAFEGAAIACAHVTRRTADTHHLGCIMCIDSDSSASQAATGQDKAQDLFDWLAEEVDVRGEASQLSRNALVSVPTSAGTAGTSAPPDAVKEALLLWQAAMMM